MQATTTPGPGSIAQDDTYSSYVDGTEVQSGTIHWTLSGKEGGEPLNMSFLFDGAWGHSGVQSVNKPLPASELVGKYYEWKYSRVYLRNVLEHAVILRSFEKNKGGHLTVPSPGRWQNPAVLTDIAASETLRANPLLKADITVPPDTGDGGWFMVKLAIHGDGIERTESPKWLLDRAPGKAGINKMTLLWDTSSLAAKLPANPSWFKIELVNQGDRRADDLRGKPALRNRSNRRKRSKTEGGNNDVHEADSLSRE